MTTVTLPRRLFGPISTMPRGRPMLVGFGGTLLLGLLLLTGASLSVGASADGRVHAGVSVGGVDLSGLTPEAARDRLAAELPPLDSGAATVEAGGDSSVVSFAELGRGHELDAMVEAAVGVARQDGPIVDAVARLRTLFHPTALPAQVHAFDAASLDRATRRIAAELSVPPVQAYVDRATFEVHPSADGQGVEAASIRDALAPLLASTSPGDVLVRLDPHHIAPVVTTDEAEAAAADARLASAPLELTVPSAAEDEAPIALTAEQIAGWIRFGPVSDRDYAMQLDVDAVGAAVTALVEQVDRDPVDARITVAGSGLGGVVAGQEGRVLQVDATTQAILAALTDRASGASVGSVAMTVDATEPALTTAEAEAMLPQMRLVSSWTTYYVPGDGNGYGNNISIGAWDLDGYNIAPGEWFSFWNGIGPVTLERGYRYGGAIINGRSVANGALAGGICSTSTTLFNAAMRFGLEIGEREAHHYYIDRYPTGLDATVLIIDDQVTDMTFRNDTDNPIVIRGYGTPGQVTFQLWSVPTGRTVVLSDPVITNRRSAIETTQLDTSLAPGTSRRVEYPHHGFHATVSRTVYDADGSVIHQNTWFSDYHTVNGITLVGPTPAAAAEPPADEPPEDA